MGNHRPINSITLHRRPGRSHLGRHPRSMGRIPHTILRGGAPPHRSRSCRPPICIRTRPENTGRPRSANDRIAPLPSNRDRGRTPKSRCTPHPIHLFHNNWAGIAVLPLLHRRPNPLRNHLRPPNTGPQAAIVVHNFRPECSRILGRNRRACTARVLHKSRWDYTPTRRRKHRGHRRHKVLRPPVSAHKEIRSPPGSSFHRDNVEPHHTAARPAPPPAGRCDRDRTMGRSRWPGA